VDLLHLFGGFGKDLGDASSGVGKMMRKKWIEFVSGLVPWDASGALAFGPYGENKYVEAAQIRGRRRTDHCDLIDKLGWEEENKAALALSQVR